MLPVVISPALDGSVAPIGIYNATFSNGLWVFDLTTLALMRFSVASSGNSVPLTSVKVDWGDGTVQTTDFRPVGRQFQYMHHYTGIGNYAITVTATNTDGTVSATNVTEVQVQDNQANTAAAPVARWAGLGLPNATFQETLGTFSTISPAEDVSLAAAASMGTRSIVVDGLEQLFVSQAQVTITQPGKMITAARVISSKFNVIELDSDLNDNYDAAISNVEVKSGVMSNSMALRANTSAPWAYPSITDIDLIKASIRMILGTNLYERVMLPTFGSGLHKIPFEQNDSITNSLVQRATVAAIQTWEPRATVQSFNITQLNNDLNVQLTLVLSTDKTQAFNVSFSLNSK